MRYDREQIRARGERTGIDLRLTLLLLFSLGFYAAIAVKLFFIVSDGSSYDALAARQYAAFQESDPKRGDIFIIEKGESKLTPIAENRLFGEVYAVPNEVKEPYFIAKELSPILGIEESVILSRISKENDPFELLKNKVSEDVRKKVEDFYFKGIYVRDQTFRNYPLSDVASHLSGFVGYSGDGTKGQYGIEGFFEDELAGKKGYIAFAKDKFGNLLNFLKESEEEATHGMSIVLTIDRVMQYRVCEALKSGIERYGAESGTVVLMEVESGKIRAMCSYPFFNANEYQKVEDISVFNNPAVFTPYEPGSVMKTITLAAAMNEEKISPESTYEDPGKIVFEGGRFIENADKKTHGTVDMVKVLVESLNTGAVYAAEQIGVKKFIEYLDAFQFGKKSGIELWGEQQGSLSLLKKEQKEINMATASFGQGMTATPIQLVSSYGVIARGGRYLPPTIVEMLIDADGATTTPKMAEVKEVITPRAAKLMGSMLVAAVEDGHGKLARVSGYHIGGKTGTAQIVNENGVGYSSRTNHTFIGFGPSERPFFVMLVKLENPTSYAYAEGTAAPLFGQIAKFVLEYYNIPPE